MAFLQRGWNIVGTYNEGWSTANCIPLLWMDLEVSAELLWVWGALWGSSGCRALSVLCCVTLGPWGPPKGCDGGGFNSSSFQGWSGS